MSRTTYLSTGWQFGQTSALGKRVGFSTSEWLPATVPGHVHLDLVDQGIIAHPFERMHELGAQWIDAEEWSYRTTFAWEPDEDLPHRRLIFEGLDSVCTVYLNGEAVAENDNMFLPVEIDVTDRLKAGDNEVRIDFRPAVKLGLERQEAYIASEGLSAAQGNFGDRAFVRKAQYMYGWDWGPRLVSCGVWKPVRLVEYASRIVDVHVVAKLEDDEAGILTITTEFEGEGVPVHVVTDDLGFESWVFPDGANVIEQVSPWSPRDMAPTLYQVQTYLLSAEEAEAVLEGDEEAELFEALDESECRVGFRTIELVREPDEFGESFEFRVNGRPFWARGANWIPDHSFPSVITRSQLRQKIAACVDMGINMLRVWGGGLYESDDFYDMCDEAGVLVWQDFPFACGFYPDTAEYVEPFRAEAEANIRRLRNHASLAVWCGNNENHQCFADRWKGDNTPPRFYGEAFYHGVIPEALAKLDPERPYTPGSACGPKDKPLEHTNQGGFGDAHYWDVWHGRGDWRFYADSTARFSSEFGFCSSPTLETWQRTLDQEDWSVYSPAVRLHDKTGKGYDKFVGLVKLHYPDPLTLEDWTYWSQLNQRDALRFGIEHFRRSEFCKGTLVWQINDCWPVQSWAFLDSSANYKALAYELRRLYADTLLSIVRDEAQAVVWAVNDSEDEVEFDVALRAYSTLTGELLNVWEGFAAVEASSRSAVLVADLAGLNVNETILVASSSVADDAWQLMGEPKNTRFAPPAPVTVSLADGDALVIRVDGPVVDLMLTDNGSPSGFLDNFLTLPEGGLAVVRTKGMPKSLEARSLAGDHGIQITRSPL